MITYTKNLAQNSGYNREEHVSNEHPVKQRQNACPRIFHTVPYNQINSGKGRKGAHVPQDFNRMKKWKRCHLNIKTKFVEPVQNKHGICRYEKSNEAVHHQSV